MQVILPPVNGEIYNDVSAEAQRITLRQPNSSVISIDTFDAVDKRNGTFKFSGNRLVLGGIKRFTLTDMNIFWNGVNVNSVNNLLRFSHSGTSYEIQVGNGSYNTPKKLMDALASAMNTAVGSSFFSWIDNANIPGFGVLQSSGDTFNFLDCPAVKYGKHLWNLVVKAPTQSIQIGQIGLVYTRWIDVSSQELTQYVKLANTATNSLDYPSPGNLLARFNTSFPQYEIGFREISRRIQSFQNFHSSNDLQTLDITFKDEWGNPLFLYDNNDIVLDVYCEC